MSTSAKFAVALGVVCALLVGILAGGLLIGTQESERYYSRANRALDAIAPDPAKGPAQSERDELMAGAKEIAVAAIMCAADHDDVMPGPDGFAEKVRPYMDRSKPDRLADFRWAYKGGRQDVLGKELSTTELGRLEGVTGDAVMNLDGHGKWVPK